MKQVMIQEAFNHLKPELPLFVISHNSAGKPNAMTCSWGMKCSQEPPMVAVAISKGKYTLKNIQATKEFVVAYPSKDMEKMITYFGSAHGDQVDKIAESNVKMVSGVYVKVPLFVEAVMNLECHLEKEIDAGDHIIVVGKVLTAHHNDAKKILAGLKGAHGSRVYQEF